MTIIYFLLCEGTLMHAPPIDKGSAVPDDVPMAPYDSTGQVVFVKGGGSGIGCATCLQLAGGGARMVVTDFSVQTARETHKIAKVAAFLLSRRSSFMVDSYKDVTSEDGL
ncbi:uncharacterized protein LOC123509531 [Portunus trituberculatus]|uniref:uncharacterized protein LOC123509531 n=1 Tax=Portunus trituberculatus TaxID=210409 RepID=UPI001E1D1EDF|nr:uncharacterized protein LOC123509531 [Portunus trituberculatus]